MTTRPRSQCDACKHLRERESLGDPMACDAFPDGIPELVLHNGMDHRQPIGHDNGIQFEAKAGDEYPEYALHP